MIPTQDSQLTFLKTLQRIFNDGQFVATYKFALLQCIASLALERKEGTDGSLELSPRDIAEKFLELYWDQARPFSGNRVLLASSGRQAALITRLLKARARHKTFAVFSRSTDWGFHVQETTQLIVKMPLWKLQTLGGVQKEFLYANGLIEGKVVLFPGIAYCLRQFYPTIVHMVRSRWIQHVCSIPANLDVLGPQADLESFLFGSDRASLSAAVPVLMEMQGGSCFYCGKAVGSEPHVDHFIPWARYPRNLGHNLVLADGRCNGDKRDTLPARQHANKWVERNIVKGDQLVASLSGRFVCDLPTAIQVARWSYECDLTAGARLWGGRGSYMAFDRNVLDTLR